MPAPKQKFPIPCASCGKTLYRLASRVKKSKNHFCDHACYGEWKRQNTRGQNSPRWNPDKPTAKCDQCGAEIFVSQSKLDRNKHHFCSVQCDKEWKRANGTYAGENNPAWVPSVVKPCDQCGKTIKRKPSRVGRAQRKYHFCSKACKYEWIGNHIAENFSGNKSHLWKGGRFGYYGPNWKQQARAARRRDGHKCRHCGASEKELGRKLDVHHIIPIKAFGYKRGQNDNYKAANDLINLISLCSDCHKKAEWGQIPIQPSLF